MDAYMVTFSPVEVKAKTKAKATGPNRTLIT
jgi:hypothetical protein